MYPIADPENQISRRLVKKIEPMGTRSIRKSLSLVFNHALTGFLEYVAVLTKPDCISPGGHGIWLKLMQDKLHAYQHGWHVVKQPNQQQLQERITYTEARQDELDFFEKIPWGTLEQSIRSRLGTTALTQVLGNTLFDLICRRWVERTPREYPSSHAITGSLSCF